MESSWPSAQPQAVERRESRLMPRTRFVLAGLLAVAAVLLFAYDPTCSTFFPPCPFHWLTGLNCPGCGSLRATHSLLHGHLGEAFGFNPLLVLSIPFLGALVLRGSWAYNAWVPWMAFGVLLAYGVLRNIPVWPLVLLAPH
jgi:hypothetical protein